MRMISAIPEASAQLVRLSVVIPVGPGERELGALFPELAYLPEQTEVLIVSAAPDFAQSDFALPAPQQRATPLNVRIISGPAGRAGLMNAGAAAALGDHLWFLHADSRLDAETCPALLRAIERWPTALLYFELKFQRPCPPLMAINECGAWLRTHIFGSPFGDQGLSLSRQLFGLLGGYPLEARYGEDHLLVWRAHHRGVLLKSTGVPLRTSARKYADRGWWAITRTYQELWWRQVVPEVVRLVRLRVGGR